MQITWSKATTGASSAYLTIREGKVTNGTPRESVRVHTGVGAKPYSSQHELERLSLFTYMDTILREVCEKKKDAGAILRKFEEIEGKKCWGYFGGVERKKRVDDRR